MKAGDNNGAQEKPTTSSAGRGQLDRQRRTVSERLFHQLARVFNGLHWGIGITTLPENASSREERSFVLMWLGIIILVFAVFAIMLYLL